MNCIFINYCSKFSYVEYSYCVISRNEIEIHMFKYVTKISHKYMYLSYIYVYIHLSIMQFLVLSLTIYECFKLIF